MSIHQWKTTQQIELDDESSCASREGEGADFVGLLSVEEQPYSNQENHSAPDEISIPTSGNDDSHDDDLSDLLALYNEVLELTRSPMDAPIPERSNVSSRPSILEETAESIVLSATSRNRWRKPLKLFSKGSKS